MKKVKKVIQEALFCSQMLKKKKKNVQMSFNFYKHDLQ